MKIKVTEIECNADELKQSNNLAEGFMNLIRGVFNGPITENENEDLEDEEE